MTEFLLIIGGLSVGWLGACHRLKCKLHTTKGKVKIPATLWQTVIASFGGGPGVEE